MHMEKNGARPRRSAATGGEAHDFVYEGARTTCISFPLGGIGTGSIGLSGAGRLIEWEIFNRPNKGSTNGFSHFAVRAERGGEVLDARILNGPFLGEAMGSFSGGVYRNFGFGADRGLLAGMPHFRHNDFDGRFPVAELDFSDPSFPGTVTLTAFNPFIPANERDSSLPAAFFEIRFTNPTDAPITYTAVGVIAHPDAGKTGVQPVRGKGWQGLLVETSDAAPNDPQYAQLMIATNAGRTSRQVHLHRGLWYDALGVYWRDLARAGTFADRVYKERNDAGGMIRDRDHSLQAGHVVVPPGEQRAVRFLIAWYVPNFEKYWVSPVWHFTDSSPAAGQWRNWYASAWKGAADVGSEAFARWNRLKADTLTFRDAFYGSSLPHVMIEAAGANLSTLKSPTVLRLEDGTLYGWEGCHAAAGSCEGSCTHVWNYQQAVAFLFPALSRGVRTVDYAYNIDETGRMSFRLGAPLGRRLSTERACADGQFGNVMVLYRDWKLSGDDAWLKALWPAVKRSIEYAWHPDNEDRWDPERTGVLWGRQHHTLDMELFGPSAWLSGYYVGALFAASEMALALGEPDTAAEYRGLAQSGRDWIAANLFNGDYFIQQIDLEDASLLDAYAQAERSRRMVGASVRALYWSEEHGELKCQLGEACFVDQLASQWHAGLYGLPDIFVQEQAEAALNAVHRYNHTRHLSSVINPGRVFGFGDEPGTIVAAWPEGTRQPAVPIPYAQETFHGMEYAAATAMLQFGLTDQAVELCTAVRARYDGTRRNPWSEMECGSNYARSLASWGLVVAAAGFAFDARRVHIGFDPRVATGGAFRGFWSSAEAWGTITIERGRAELQVLYGTLVLASLGLPLARPGPIAVSINGSKRAAKLEDGAIRLRRTRLKRGDALRVEAEGIALSGRRGGAPARGRRTAADREAT